MKDQNYNFVKDRKKNLSLLKSSYPTPSLPSSSSRTPKFDIAYPTKPPKPKHHYPHTSFTATSIFMTHLSSPSTYSTPPPHEGQYGKQQRVITSLTVDFLFLSPHFLGQKFSVGPTFFHQLSHLFPLFQTRAGFHFQLLWALINFQLLHFSRTKHSHTIKVKIK